MAVLLAVGALPPAAVLGAAPAPAATASGGRSPLAGTHPGWATASSDAGAVATDAT